MKKKNLLKLALCAMALLPMGAWAAVTTSLTTRTTITFDGTTTGTYQGADASSGAESTFTNYSLAVYGTATGRVITSVAGSVSGTIAGVDYSVSKYLTMNSTVAWTTSEFTQRTAGGDNLGNNTFAPCIAFNTGVAGTVYVAVERRGSGNGSVKFAYQTTGTEDPSKYKLSAAADVNIDDDGGKRVLSYNVPEATTVLIRGNAKFYAIRFVPAATSTTVLTASSFWNFDQYTVANNTVAIAGGSSTSFKDYSGLYIHNRGSHAHNSHTASSVTEQTQSGYTMATAGSVKAMLLAAETNSFSGLTTGLANNSTNAYDGFAVEIGCPGTLYVAYKCGGNRKAFFYENGVNKSGEGTALTSGNTGILSHTVTNVYPTTTISFGVTGDKLYILSVLFVPSSATTMSISKTIGSEGYITFCAPQNYTVPTGVTAYYVSSVDDTEKKAMLTPITAGNVIPACTGVILEGNAGNYTFDSSETYSSVTNQMKANLGDYTLPADNSAANSGVASEWNYTLAAGPTFKHSSGSGTLAAGKAFLRTTVNVTGGGSSRSINLVFDEDETTGISTVKVQNEEVTNGEYYDLMGRRVTTPTKGLYIVNGKKVFIK